MSHVAQESNFIIISSPARARAYARAVRLCLFVAATRTREKESANAISNGKRFGSCPSTSCARQGMDPKPPCVWDETEVLLKASTEHRDQSLAALWVRGYIRNMVCFPRLHIVSDNVSTVRSRFASIPNVSFHQLQYPDIMLNAGLGHSVYSKDGAKRIHGLPAVYFAIQWPMMWADNFTTARHVLIFDTDTLPVVPLRCHHFFDEAERPIWHTWAWPKPPAWLRHVNALFNATQQPTAPGIERAPIPAHGDFMTFFPVVIPRIALPMARDAVARAYGAHFDEAWLRMKNPSYGDIIGKTAAMLVPDAIKVVHCPAVGKIKQLIPTAELEAQKENECRDLVTTVEHLKHPFRDCHTGHCHHLARSSAVQYGARLLAQGAAFQRGEAPLPTELFHYQSDRSRIHQQALESRVNSLDQPGRLCGMPRQVRADARNLPAAPAAAVSLVTLGGTEPPAASSNSADLALLVYDNKYNASVGPLPRHLLYRSALQLHVPVHIGSLVPASVRKWQPGDRELWLMQTLPTLKQALVVLLDGFDTVLMCSAAELADKWRRLAGHGRILISTEKQLWPEEGMYHGERQSGPTGVYPKPLAHGSKGEQASAALSRYINIGALIGSPTALSSLLRCMSTRYASFPYQCPLRDTPNGTYEYISTAPFRTRRIGWVRGNWGWEQACFHTYLMEQANGALPETCPHLVLDHLSDFVLNFNKIGPKLVWPWAVSEPMRSPFSNAPSCVLHANGAGKYAMPVMHFWWDTVHAKGAFGRSRSLAAQWHGREHQRAQLLRNFSALYVQQWVQALKPQLLRESSAILMLKDALRSLPSVN